MKNVRAPFYKSFVYAFEGILSALKSERNMMIHFVIAILVVTFGFIFNITATEWLVCLILFALVISSELVNTAFEMLVDLCEPNKNPKAKFCKDVAAGAVLVNAIIAAVAGLIIFVPYVLNF